MSSPIDKAQNYLDLNGLNSITRQSKSGDDEGKKDALEAAAKQFEAIFMQMLLKSMRKAQDVLESDSPFNSETTKFYRDMHDEQLAVELSSNGSLGLSDLIVRQLGGGDENYTPSSALRTDGQGPSFDNKDKTAILLDQQNLNPFSSNQERSNGNSSSNTELSPQLTRLLSKNKQLNEESRQEEANIPFSELIELVKKDQRFDAPKDFVTTLTEPAKKVEEALGIPHQVVIAQAALETGWGKKVIVDQRGESSNNLFNIKADSRWGGDTVTKETLEFEQGEMVKKKEPFRMYETLDESVNDYINFLSDNPRYKDALEQAGDVEQFLHGIQKAGYATDPQYAEKIMNTLKRVSGFLE